MKEEYDFSNAQQGRFYIPVEEIELPRITEKDGVAIHVQLMDEYSEAFEKLSQ